MKFRLVSIGALWSAIFAVVFAMHSTSAVSQDECRFLSGLERRQCDRDANKARADANRRAADAQKEALKASQASRSTGIDRVQPNEVRPGQSVDRNAASSAYAERPVIDLTAHPAMMTVVIHPAYSRNPGRLKLPVARSCSGASNSDEFTFNKACKVQILQGAQPAVPLFRQSCDEGDPSGCYMLARLTGGLTGKPEAVALFENACESGEQDACYELAELYRVGTGVAKDQSRTRAYYERACTGGNYYSCAWLQGKIDAECPHGHRAYKVDFDKHTYRVFCVVSTTGLDRKETELKPSAAELADMKEYGEYMRTHDATPIGDLVREMLRPNSGGGRCRQDTNDSNGVPISGSGCAGGQ